jgi:hypothetical protein
MTELRNWFDSYLANNTKLPQQVKETVQEKWGSTYGDDNPYSWMKSLQTSLLPSDKGMRSNSGISQSSNSTKNHDHYRGGHPTGPGLLKFIQKTAAAHIVDRSENRKVVEEMLTGAHKFIELRQHTVAEKILAWRDNQVGSWRDVLGERYPAQTPNGVVDMLAPVAITGELKEQQLPILEGMAATMKWEYE